MIQGRWLLTFLMAAFWSILRVRSHLARQTCCRLCRLANLQILREAAAPCPPPFRGHGLELNESIGYSQFQIHLLVLSCRVSCCCHARCKQGFLAGVPRVWELGPLPAATERRLRSAHGASAPKLTFARLDHGCGRVRGVKIIGKNSFCFIDSLGLQRLRRPGGRDVLQICNVLFPCISKTGLETDPAAVFDCIC